MFSRKFILALLLFFSSQLHAFVLSFDNNDFNTNTTFNNVAEFNFQIDVDGDLSSGVYMDPMLNGVIYQVRGVLDVSTPSGFSAFDLMRDIDGADFYGQGSSLWFEIAANADLSDGLQADELVPNAQGQIFIFNGREIENGRFHPALLELNSDGTGRIQNSNNIPNTTVGEIDFGAEYVTDLQFQVADLTLAAGSGSSGGGTSGFWLMVMLLFLFGGRKHKTKLS